MAKGTFDFDYRDYVEVREYEVKEQLSVEDIEEGLEPMDMFAKFCLTDHAHGRMGNTAGRDCDWSDIEDLLKEKGHKLFDLVNGEEFLMKSNDNKFGMVGIAYISKGKFYVVIKTLIQNVIVVNNKVIATQTKFSKSGAKHI